MLQAYLKANGASVQVDGAWGPRVSEAYRKAGQSCSCGGADSCPPQLEEKAAKELFKTPLQ